MEGTVAQAYQDGNYVGLATTIISFFLLVLGIVYVQVTLLVLFNRSSISDGKEILTIVSTKDFRKKRGRFHSTMPQDTPAEVEGFRNLLTYRLRSVFQVAV